MTCLFHYHLDTTLVMCYLGGNYTVTHHSIEGIIKIVIVDTNLISQSTDSSYYLIRDEQRITLQILSRLVFLFYPTFL